MTKILASNLAKVAQGEMTLGEFQDWFVVYTLGRTPVPAEDAAIAEDIESAMAEYTGGHISEWAFSRVLIEHARPVTIRKVIGPALPRPLLLSSSLTRTVPA